MSADWTPLESHQCSDQQMIVSVKYEVLSPEDSPLGSVRQRFLRMANPQSCFSCGATTNLTETTFYSKCCRSISRWSDRHLVFHCIFVARGILFTRTLHWNWQRIRFCKDMYNLHRSVIDTVVVLALILEEEINLPSTYFGNTLRRVFPFLKCTGFSTRPPSSVRVRYLRMIALALIDITFEH